MRVRRSYLSMPILGAQIFALLPDDGAGGDGAQTGAPQQPTQGDPGPAGGDGALRQDLHEERKRRQAAERRAAELEEIQRKADEATLSEQQKVAKRAAEAEERAAKAEARALRLEVAAEVKLSASMAARLVGSTREELEADAKQMLADAQALAGHAGTGTSGEGQGSTEAQSAGARRIPRPDLSQGSKQTAPPSGRDAGLAEARRRFAPKEPAKG